MATNDNDNDGNSSVVVHNGSTVALDEEFYYYQNPKTGQVSATPLSTRQLIKLLVPVRENNNSSSNDDVPRLQPILPSTTQVSKVVVAAPTSPPSASSSSSSSLSSSSFGKWTSVSEIDILKEASCQQWYLTSSSLSSSSSEPASNNPPEGPCSCRKLVKLVEDFKQQQQQQGGGGGGQSQILVFAQNITPEWTDVSKLPNLQYVLVALQDQQKQQELQTDHDNAIIDNYSDQQHSKQVQDELEAFLRSTDDDDAPNDDGDDNEGEGGSGNSSEQNVPPNSKVNDSTDRHVFEADDGMRYVRDPMTGNWIHEGLAPTTQQQSESTANVPGSGDTTNNKNKGIGDGKQQRNNKKKKKKSQFSKRNAKQWVYISGLPTDDDKIDVGDVQRYFSKAGMLDLDPETLQPKIKLYRDRSTHKLKGDASVCYARPESVELALQILDDSLWDEHHRIKVERAHFEAKSNEDGSGGVGDGQNGGSGSNSNKKRKIEHSKRRPVSEAQRKVARLALLQAQDDGFGERLAGGRKGLRIIVIKGIMEGIPDDKLEETLHEICKEYGDVEKITCISRTQVVIVKFVEPLAASSAVEALNGSLNPRSTSTIGGNSKKKIEAIFWDGVTDYTNLPGDDLKEREDEEKRHDEFGNWLDSQEELPPELQLQVAGDD